MPFFQLLSFGPHDRSSVPMSTWLRNIFQVWLMLNRQPPNEHRDIVAYSLPVLRRCKKAVQRKINQLVLREKYSQVITTSVGYAKTLLYLLHYKKLKTPLRPQRTLPVHSPPLRPSRFLGSMPPLRSSSRSFTFPASFRCSSCPIYILVSSSRSSPSQASSSPEVEIPQTVLHRVLGHLLPVNKLADIINVPRCN